MSHDFGFWSHDEAFWLAGFQDEASPDEFHAASFPGAFQEELGTTFAAEDDGSTTRFGAVHAMAETRELRATLRA